MNRAEQVEQQILDAALSNMLLYTKREMLFGLQLEFDLSSRNIKYTRSSIIALKPENFPDLALTLVKNAANSMKYSLDEESIKRLSHVLQENVARDLNLIPPMP